MSPQRVLASNPRASVVISSHERPDLLEVAVRCFEAQSLEDAELIVVDDSRSSMPDWIRESFKYLDVPPGTPLGEKLNLGFENASGDILVKWDDDDFYAPAHLARAVRALSSSGALVTFAQPFLIYDAVRRQLRRSDTQRCSGATLAFLREVWERHPFRSVPEATDSEFLLDVVSTHGPTMCRGVDHGFDFVQLRHTLHLWNRMPDGTEFDAYFKGCELVDVPISDVVGASVATTWTQLDGL